MTNMKLNLSYSVLGLILCGALHAATWQPYAEAQITMAQWQEYYDSVVAELGDTREELAEAKLVSFTDQATHTFYAFTAADHPAHPAWITRQVVEQDGGISIQQIGYFAGEEDPFAALFDDYLALSEELRAGFAGESESTD